VYNPLSEEDIHFIVGQLDGELEQSIGYDLVKLAEKQLELSQKS